MNNYSIKKILTIALIFLSLFFLGFKIWLSRYFGQVDLDLLLININFGFNGLLDTDEYLIQRFFQIVILLPIIITIIFYFLFIRVKNSKNKIIIFASLFSMSFLYFISGINVFKSSFITDHSLFIEENYIQPKIKGTDFNNKKNLILIYLESFEKDYLTNKNLNRNIINEIDLGKDLMIDLPNFYQTKYNDYTMGAIVSSQCGIPQKPFGIFNVRNAHEKKDNGDNKNFKDIFGIKKFLPGAVCLGDILKHHQYKNTFLNSGDINFQQMNKFFNTHGYNKLIGKKFFTNKVLPKNSWSGNVNDSVLFDNAIKMVNEHMKKKEFFNITILTTDTHYPGFIDSNCPYKDLDDKKIHISIYCTSNSLSNLIQKTYLKYPEKISVILIGDHLNPKNQMNINFDRFIFAKILSKKDYIIKRDKMTHYDLYPSILQLINIDYGNNLGLGKSIFNKIENTEYEEFLNDLNINIVKKSKYYDKFWK